MAGVKILIEGYAKEKGGTEFASSTTTLIREGNLNIIVDPGMNRGLLLEALEKEGLSPAEINYVVLTHYHLDHSLLAGIFKNAEVLDDGSIYSFNGKIKDHDGKIPETDIEIIKTPGHDPFHCSVVVKADDLGKIVIASDVFWWETGQEQKTDKESLIEHKDPYVKNKEALINSRKKVLEIADYIIPGHGKMFKCK